MLRAVALAIPAVLIVAGCGQVDSSPPSTSSAAATTTLPAVEAGGTTVRLLAVLDGDSIEVESAGRTIEVRLVGINAPERDECRGDASRAALEAILEGAQVTLIPAGDDDQDRYGRLLRYVAADGVPVAEQLLDGGHATVLQGSHERDDLFVSLAEAAAVAGRGMWRPDACGPASTATITIAAVEYDPPGRDRDNPAAEYVVIRNDGTNPVDLTDWTLRDESSLHRYRFPIVTLAAGAELRIRSGCGDDDEADRYWCAGDAVWSNGGDTVLLLDPYGNVAARRLYRGDY